MFVNEALGEKKQGAKSRKTHATNANGHPGTHMYLPAGSKALMNVASSLITERLGLCAAGDCHMTWRPSRRRISHSLCFDRVLERDKRCSGNMSLA
uniref:Uncharacterized protein n=1 Tax=Sphaeramia orbicularis TaxID=375764 RepID=A0A672YD28_9TELE